MQRFHDPLFWINTAHTIFSSCAETTANLASCDQERGSWCRSRQCYRLSCCKLPNLQLSMMIFIKSWRRFLSVLLSRRTFFEAFNLCGFLQTLPSTSVDIYQCGLLQVWSCTSVTFYQWRYLPVWSSTSVTFHQRDLSAVCPSTSVALDKCDLLQVWPSTVKYVKVLKMRS